MSLFTSFNAGVSGIQASQSGLNTTAHNLSNADTKGYTRQQNINTDLYYRTIKTSPNGNLRQGYGTTVSQIRQIRDIFLDKEYRVEVGRQSFYEKLLETDNEIEDILGEMEGVEYRESIQELWDVIKTSLLTNPENIVNRELFISKAEAFLESAQNVYSALETYQTSLNKEISDQVASVNSIGDQIAQLNIKIAESESSHVENANDLRDARNQLMDELGKYVKYTYDEDRDGTVQIYINNAPLVIEGLSYHMKCEKIEFTEKNPETGETEVVEGSPMYKVVWADNGYDDVYNLDRAFSTAENNGNDIGSLYGILVARGNKVANYGDIPVAPVKEDYIKNGVFDETAYKVAQNEFQADLKVYNNTTGNSILTATQAQFDLLIHGIVTAINDIFCPNIEADLTGVSGTGQDGQTVNLDGNYRILDVLNCAVGADDKETIGTEVFSRNNTPRYQIITLDAQIYKTDADGNKTELARDNGDGTYSLYVYQEEDINDVDTMYTIQNMCINEALEADFSLLPIKANPSGNNYGEYDFDMLQDLMSIWDDKFAVLDPNSITKYTFEDYYTALVGEIGIKGNVWQGMVDDQTSLVESIEDKRQQVAGVSTDEELTTLLLYQHAYNAASRYITTIDSMLQYLIERLG